MTFLKADVIVRFRIYVDVSKWLNEIKLPVSSMNASIESNQQNVTFTVYPRRFFQIYVVRILCKLDKTSGTDSIIIREIRNTHNIFMIYNISLSDNPLILTCSTRNVFHIYF